MRSLAPSRAARSSQSLVRSLKRETLSENPPASINCVLPAGTEFRYSRWEVSPQKMLRCAYEQERQALREFVYFRSGIWGNRWRHCERSAHQELRKTLKPQVRSSQRTGLGFKIQ